MADGISFDFSDVTKLAADLGTLAGGAALSRNMETAVAVTSGKVKKDAQSTVRGVKDMGQAASSITYDVKRSGAGVEAEVGYDKDRGPGALGNLIEFGAPNARPYGNPNADPEALAPHNDLANALEKNQADLEKGLSVAAEQAEKAVGL